MSIRNLFKNSAVYALATYVQRTLGFILIPFYTRPRFLAISDFGDFNLIYTLIAFMTFFFTMGQDAAYLKFRFLRDEKKENVFVTAFLNLLFLSILFSLLIYLFRIPLKNFLGLSSSRYLLFGAVILAFDTLSNSFYNWLRAEEKPVTFSSVKIFRFILELSLNFIFLVGLKLGIWGILYANVTAAIFNFVLLLFLGRKNLRGRWKKPLAYDMLIFGLPFLPNGLAFIATEFSDRIIITRLLDKETMAVYAGCYKWGTLIQFLVLAFRNAWQPFFLKAAKDEPEAAPAIYAKVIHAVFFGLTLLWIPGALFIGDMVTYSFPGFGAVLGDPAYWNTVAVIPVVMLAYVYFGLYVSFTPGFYIKERGGRLALITISGFVINITVNLLFITRWGYMVAAWATLAAYGGMAVIIIFIGQKQYPIPFNTLHMGKIILLQVLTLLFYFILEPSVDKKLLFLLAVFPYLYITRLFNFKELTELPLKIFSGKNKQ